MINSKFKIVSVASEVDPYTRTGGLADIARSLPKALKRLGHDVIVVTPFYGGAMDPKKSKLKKIIENLSIIIDNDNKEHVNVWQGDLLDGLPIYFIENEKYFSETKNIKHGSSDIYKSKNPNRRFLLFDLAVLKLLTKIGFKADIIHCHDWQTGLIPYFRNRDFLNSTTLKNAATVFTIHNLTFQLGANWWEISPENRDSGKNGLPNFSDDKIEYVNFAKRAILNADVINAVSETYADEILEKENGQELQTLLKNRKDRLFGIVNGIDYKEYNSHKDPGLHRNFDWHNTETKTKNKLFLQKYYGLPQNEKIPLLCMSSRIAEQKGFDLVRDIGDLMFRFNLQMIVMGDGDKKLINALKKIERDHPNKLVWTPFDQKMETSLYAGSDIILIPSRFEPCGLTQMKSMRYGCVPVARHVGGYVDTVIDYSPNNTKGNGFVFTIYDSRAMMVAITRAIEAYKRKGEWKELVKKVMQKSYSWEYPAGKYIDLYKTALRLKWQDQK